MNRLSVFIDMNALKIILRPAFQHGLDVHLAFLNILRQFFQAHPNQFSVVDAIG